MCKVIKAIPLELIIWLSAFGLLYNLDTSTDQTTICPVHHLGFKWCPGCGLGRSINLFFHGQFKASFAMHWMGIPVIIVLSYRIFQLLTDYIQKLNYKNDTY